MCYGSLNPKPWAPRVSGSLPRRNQRPVTRGDISAAGGEMVGVSPQGRVTAPQTVPNPVKSLVQQSTARAPKIDAAGPHLIRRITPHRPPSPLRQTASNKNLVSPFHVSRNDEKTRRHSRHYTKFSYMLRHTCAQPSGPTSYAYSGHRQTPSREEPSSSPNPTAFLTSSGTPKRYTTYRYI